MSRFTPSPNNVSGDLDVEGTLEIGVARQRSDSELKNSTVTFYLDEKTNQLKVKVKYSNGTIKSGIVRLS